MKKLLLWIYLLFFSLLGLFAIEAPKFITGRDMAMGGPHISLADDYSVLFNNPAGLANLTSQFTVFRLGINIQGASLDTINLVQDSSLSVNEKVIKFFQSKGSDLYAGGQVYGPINFSYTDKGWGIGLFQKSRMTIDLDGITDMKYNISHDLLLTGGYAYRFDFGNDHSLDLGVSAKVNVRGEVQKYLGLVELLSYITNPANLLASPYTFTIGFGFDGGLRWNFNKEVSIALAVQNIYSPAFSTKYDNFLQWTKGVGGSAISYSTLDRSIDFGIHWKPNLEVLKPIISSLVIALDYRDILGLLDPLSRNPILNIGVGVELQFLNVISLLVGLNETLLSTGIGLDIGPVRVGINFFGSEVGKEPGSKSVLNMVFDIEVKL